MQKAENEEQRSDLKASLNWEGGRGGVEVAATVEQNRGEKSEVLMYRVYIKLTSSPDLMLVAQENSKPRSNQPGKV